MLEFETHFFSCVPQKNLNLTLLVINLHLAYLEKTADTKIAFSYIIGWAVYFYLFTLVIRYMGSFDLEFNAMVK